MAKDECPGCVGRGTGTACCICRNPIPEQLRRRPGDPSELSDESKKGGRR